MILQGEWRLRTLLMVLLALTTLVALASLLAVGGGLLLWQQPEVRRSSVALVNREAAQLAERMELLLGGLQRQMELAGTLVARSPRDLPVALFDALTGPGQSFDALYVADGSGVIEAVSLRPEMLIHRQELLGSDLSANRL
ncbi:MAG: hypothetical protein OEU93_16235, partial [Rubrivivax sp.]|nr:hypothetical protein [Rubrivivax sp.]